VLYVALAVGWTDAESNLPSGTRFTTVCIETGSRESMRLSLGKAVVGLNTILLQASAVSARFMWLCCAAYVPMLRYCCGLTGCVGWLVD
jgi:hypothetical protein